MSDLIASSKLDSALGLSLRTGLGLNSEATPDAIQSEVLLLFDKTGSGLNRYVRSLGLGADATQDVLQEVFLSLFRHLSLGRPRHNLQGWLFRVAHNLALKNRQRRRRQQTENVLDDTFVERLIDPAANPEQQVAYEQRRQRLRSVFRVLPERDRRCLYLRAEGLRYRDIATTLGMSLGSVAKSLTRSMTRLTNADVG